MQLSLDAYYAALDVTPDASLDELKSARRELALIWHPDRFPDDEALRRRASDKLRFINEAYDAVTAHVRAEEARTAIQARDNSDLRPPPDAPDASAGEAIVTGPIPLDGTVLTVTLGLAMGDGAMADILIEGSAAPCAASKTFTNGHDWQDELAVEIVRSEPDAAPVSLGRYAFVDLPPRPRGLLRMEVTFSVAERGHVRVSALDLDTHEPILIAPRPA